MSTEATRPTVEFTADAERVLNDRTKAFTEQLRLAAIDEAIRRRGSAHEVTGSDVLRANSVEQTSLAAYTERLDSMLHTLEANMERTHAENKYTSEQLRTEFARLLDTVGSNKEQQQLLERIYRRIKEQTYEGNLQIRNELVHQLKELRGTLQEKPQTPLGFTSSLERILWMYLVIGIATALIGLFGRSIVEYIRDPVHHRFELIGLSGLLLSGMSGLMLFFQRLRDRKFLDRERSLERYSESFRSR